MEFYVILLIAAVFLLLPIGAWILLLRHEKKAEPTDPTQKRKKVWIRLICTALYLAIILVSLPLGISAYVKLSTSDRILSPDEANSLSNVDCILVLGCSVRKDGTPSDMLADRLTRGIDLYERGVAPKLLMSGDHGNEDYNEVGVMKQFAANANVPSADIFMDHAGFSTYESLYRAKTVFCADKIIIVTQEYHLFRALYIAESLGLEAYGVSSDYRTYRGQFVRDVREVLARVKDVATSSLKPFPTYLGDTIPINGNGDATNDE